MKDTRNIGLAIPTYERDGMLFESFAEVYADPRLTSISIVDDASNYELFNRIKTKCAELKKIKLTRQVSNQDCYRNKMTAIMTSPKQWNILLDSDNVLKKEYIDTLFKIPKWEPDTIYTPDFAWPNFDFRAYSGLLITKQNVAEWIDKPLFQTMLNACNYFVRKDSYLKVFDGTVDPVTSDSIYFCLKWLVVGNKIQVVEGLNYFHRVHPESHYQNNVARTAPGFHESVLTRLRNLT
jgi:glycosyltransferase involved in cell wall biosynthesis